MTYIVLGIGLICLVGYGAYLNHENHKKFDGKDLF